MLEDLPKAWVAMGHEDVRAEGQESRARRLSRRARCAADMLVLATKPKWFSELKDTLGLKFVEKVTRTPGLTPGLRNFSRACTDPACLGTSAL